MFHNDFGFASVYFANFFTLSRHRLAFVCALECLTISVDDNIFISKQKLKMELLCFLISFKLCFSFRVHVYLWTGSQHMKLELSENLTIPPL